MKHDLDYSKPNAERTEESFANFDALMECQYNQYNIKKGCQL